MVWIFATAVFLASVYVLIRNPEFAKRVALGVGVLLVLGVGAGVATYLYYEREDARAKSLIKADQLRLEAMMLSEPFRYETYVSDYWDLKGDITNNSEHHVKRIELKIQLQDCPQPHNCMTVGEDDESIWTDIPPKQKRAFSGAVSFKNMPKLTSWTWTYRVTEVRAKTD